MRWRNRAGDLGLQASLFATRWRDIQSDYLLGNGLVGTRNVGDARNLGMDMLLRYEGVPGWRAELGGTVQRARLHDAVPEVADEDARLPVVPDLRWQLSLQRQLDVGRWRGRLSARLDHNGPSRLSFDAGLDRRTPAFRTVSAGAALARDGLELQLQASNLLDSGADTFAFGNPFAIRSVAQRTPLQPRRFTLQVSRSW
jgi:hypothetical protein